MRGPIAHLWLLSTGWLAILLPATCPAAVPDGPKRPNVLVVLADDAGWGDFSLTGNRTVSTPSIDSLAADGCLLETFFVQPVCAPTRAELLTGRWHPRGGVRGVTLGQERLSPTERTLADVLSAAGYTAGCFGKWHNGTQWPYHPLARGFARFYGFTEGHWGSYFDAPMEENGRFVTGRGYIADDITDHAIGFMNTVDRPFLCYVAYNTPHSPMCVPDEEWRRFRERELAQPIENEEVDFTRAALAMVENLDRNVGRLLESLDRRGVVENTIVVFFSDNGPNSGRWCGGMRGRKATTDDGGVRSVCCIRWPSKIPRGSRITDPTAAIDLLPTIAGLAEVRTTGCLPLDGVDLSPVLTHSSRAAAAERTLAQRPVISSFNGKVSVRTATHRLDAAGRLYDMQSDPGQTTDIADEHRDIADRLRKVADEWRTDVLSAAPAPDVERFPVGFPGAPHTELPARDGLPHGGVTRSAKAPNCCYFTNWTNPDDSITWEVDVLAGGSFEAELWYTCPAADVGAVVELSCETSSSSRSVTGSPGGTSIVESRSASRTAISRAVTEAFDPPLNLGQDRVERRGESHDKAFKPLVLGRLSLPAGPTTLTLRATAIPGTNVADVRRLVLRPVER